MTNIKGKSILVPIASILAILAFAGDMVSSWDYIKDNLSDELFPILTNALVLLPAIIGLLKFTNREVSNWVLGGFVLYALLVVVGYLNVYFADDPLAAGLPMVVFVLPFALLFSGYLMFKLK